MARISKAGSNTPPVEIEPKVKSNLVKNVSGVAQTGVKVVSGLDKLREANLKRMGTLSHQLKVKNAKGESDMLNMFVRDPSNINQSKNPLSIVKNYVNNSMTKSLDRVMLNPKITENVRPADLEKTFDSLGANLKNLNYNPKQIDNLLSTIDQSKFVKIDQSKFGKGVSKKALKNSNLQLSNIGVEPLTNIEERPYNSTVLDNFERPWGDSADVKQITSPPEKYDWIYDLGIMEPKSTKVAKDITLTKPSLNYMDNLKKIDAPGMKEGIKGFDNTFSKNKTISQNDMFDVFNDPSNRVDPNLGNLRADVNNSYIDGVPSDKAYENSNLSSMAITKGTEKIANAQVSAILEGGNKNIADVISTISKGEKAAKFAGQAGQVTGQVAGAVRIGNALSDGLDKGDIGEIAKGAVGVATPWLVAAGPAGWAVLGAAALHDLFGK